MQGLKYISWGDSTGYAVAAKAYVRALIDHGIALTWAPMMPNETGYELLGVKSWPCPKLTSVCNTPLNYDTVLIHTVPEYYPQLIEQERRSGKRVFGYTVWELERLPAHWPAILNQLDGVLVPCNWNIEVFRQSGVTVPIHVVPHLSQFEDMSTTDDNARNQLRARLPQTALAYDPFVFYTIGFWSNRKAPYLALQAYLQAFTADDPVLMIIKTSSKDITRWHRHWRNLFRLRHPSPARHIGEMRKQYRKPAAVALIADETLSDAEMYALHELGDCFVSLTRTEGWGLGAFEAARFGKPVVMTAYGGQLDFLDSQHSHLIDYRLVPVHEPTWSSYQSGDLWAEPSVAQAASALRHVLKHRQESLEQAHRQAEKIAVRFSRQSIVNALCQALA